MNEIYRLEKVTKKYKNTFGDSIALNNIDLILYEGDIIVVLGPSGSGKSTMLNVLSGIDRADGNIKFYDTFINKLNDDELIIYRRNNLGFIFQSYNLIANLTVKENIELGSNLTNNPLNIKEIITEVELEEHYNKYPYQLSGGQMQRVAIARALVKNPKVLFCDEPTGALDEKTGKRVLELLQKINKEHKTTMIIVTHNPSIALMGNVVIKMNSGNITSIVRNEEVKDAKDLRWA
ncbi:MAG: ABC transporter ATP-binding protein [Bacilli bacterium]|nr:ABC transporter ATP-binding protein [Bacilli bacterium]